MRSRFFFLGCRICLAPFCRAIVTRNGCVVVLLLWAWIANAAATSYPLEVFPPEHKRMADPRTSAELLFLTTAPENDSNLYFHEYSWLGDESVILFTSSRAKGGLMGYLTATGEL